MKVEAVRNLLDADASRAEMDRVLVSIGGDAEAAVVEVRRFIDELGPSALADTDLVTALRRLVDDYLASGVSASLVLDPELPVLAPATEVALYRVASEALRNVARHAKATRCQVALRLENCDVVLEVVDDGVGLRGQPPGVGRRAMADRVTALDGVFAVADSAVGGVRVSARLQAGSR
jgi:signal transduction histidine kinase